ncbi:MAG: class I SAM-dependent methyltransferase [Rhodospirillales bacterium]|nr:class I SAM-dependent methyltransferase [Rhodospirillales bacterium]MDP6804604.1 class I SAM-dependent methyltransferase [Rhodospirillales bacterium]
MRGNSDKDWLKRVYHADGRDDLARTYDEWAEDYETDVIGYGYKNPALVTATVTRHVDPGDGVILDAGAGTGIIGEVLAVLDYRELVAVDMSDGMLALADKKGAYREVRNMVLGEPLDFADGAFACVVCAGTLTVGHAPPESLHELVRVTRSGGVIIFTVTRPAYLDGGFKAKMDALEAERKWKSVEASDEYLPLPNAPKESSLMARVYVYQAV